MPPPVLGAFAAAATIILLGVTLMGAIPGPPEVMLQPAATATPTATPFPRAESPAPGWEFSEDFPERYREAPVQELERIRGFFAHRWGVDNLSDRYPERFFPDGWGVEAGICDPAVPIPDNTCAAYAGGPGIVMVQPEYFWEDGYSFFPLLAHEYVHVMDRLQAHVDWMVEGVAEYCMDLYARERPIHYPDGGTGWIIHPHPRDYLLTLTPRDSWRQELDRGTVGFNKYALGKAALWYLFQELGYSDRLIPDYWDATVEFGKREPVWVPGESDLRVHAGAFEAVFGFPVAQWYDGFILWLEEAR